MSIRLIPLSILACVTAFGAAEAADRRVAIFDVAFIDTSTEGAVNGIRADEEARLELFNAQLRAAFAERGYELLALDPVQETLDATLNPAQCNNCELRMGETLGAELVVTSEVQKVSNLILAINLVVREVESGDRIRIGAADIRGNNDRSWERGLSYLLRNRIFRDGEP